MLGRELQFATWAVLVNFNQSMLQVFAGHCSAKLSQLQARILQTLSKCKTCLQEGFSEKLFHRCVFGLSVLAFSTNLHIISTCAHRWTASLMPYSPPWCNHQPVQKPLQHLMTIIRIFFKPQYLLMTIQQLLMLLEQLPPMNMKLMTMMDGKRPCRGDTVLHSGCMIVFYCGVFFKVRHQPLASYSDVDLRTSRRHLTVTVLTVR
jgi:hypothetical protein